MLYSVIRDPSHSTQRSSRLRGWSTAATWRWLSAIAVLMTAVLSGSPSSAVNTGNIHLSSLEPDKIEVDSNGTEYTAISGHPLTGLYSEISVHLERGVRSWSVHLTLTWGDENLPMRDYRIGRNYDPPVTKVQRTVPLAVPQEAYRDWIVDQCNRIATSLRNSGQSDKAIFGQDRKFIVSVEAAYTYDFSTLGKVLIEGGNPQQTIEVTCKKWGGIAVPQAGNGVSASPTVNSAQLTVIETSGASGACKVKLSGIVETSSPNMEVRYRYEDGAGHESEVHTIKTDHSKTGLFYHEYNVPNDAGTEQGRIRLVGVSHAFKSAWKAYNMNCVDPGATDFSASLPPTLTLSLGAVPNNNVMINGQVCPKQVRLAGKIKGNGHFHGYAVFHGTAYISPPQSYEVENGDTDWVFALYDLKWEHDINQLAVPDTDNEPMQQTIKFGFNVNGSDTPGAHVKVKHQPVATVPLKPYKFACQWPKVTPGIQGGSGLTGQLPAPPAQQQTGQTLAGNAPVATAAPRFSIQLPRGMVQQGVIRLQGVADKKAKFVLSWFARTNGAYKAVHARGLPEAMAGAAAKFDIKALSAARDWRLKICPQGATSESACRQTDFKAPAKNGQ
jgi:hypothetical protein